MVLALTLLSFEYRYLSIKATGAYSGFLPEN